MIAVEARNVMKSIHGHQILNDVSFSANEGERIGIIGQNGSGKSMLFKALSGLLLPDSGTIKVWGQAVGKNSFPFGFWLSNRAPWHAPAIQRHGESSFAGEYTEEMYCRGHFFTDASVRP